MLPFCESERCTLFRRKGYRFNNLCEPDELKRQYAERCRFNLCLSMRAAGSVRQEAYCPKIPPRVVLSGVWRGRLEWRSLMFILSTFP